LAFCKSVDILKLHLHSFSFRATHFDLWQRDPDAARRVVVLPIAFGLRAVVQSLNQQAETSPSDAARWKLLQQKREAVNRSLKALDIDGSECIIWPVHLK
jgi:hypothetical protein